MNKEYLKRQMWRAHYVLKGDTGATYLHQSYVEVDGIEDKTQRKIAVSNLVDEMQADGQEMLLPLRICFINGDDSAPVCSSGRGMKRRIKQMKANFTIPERSPYKIAKPYKVSTSVWQVDGHKCFFYGTIGITMKENSAPRDNGDLVIFYTSDWVGVDVFIFRGLVTPNEIANLQEAVEFVEAIIIIG